MTEQSPPYDPLGRLVTLAEPDRRAMGNVDPDLIAAYWHGRHTAKAAQLTDDELSRLIRNSDERLQCHRKTARAWPQEKGWNLALHSERRKREGKRP